MYEEIIKMSDDSTVETTISHVFQSDYFGNRGRDRCMEMFGEEDEECREYNAKLDAET